MENIFKPIRLTNIIPFYYASTKGKIYVLKEKADCFFFYQLKESFPDKKLRLSYVTLNFVEINRVTRRTLPVHWLIATTFHGHHELAGYKIFFKDNDRLNTAVDNLEWRIDTRKGKKLFRKLEWTKDSMSAQALKLVSLKYE